MVANRPQVRLPTLSCAATVYGPTWEEEVRSYLVNGRGTAPMGKASGCPELLWRHLRGIDGQLVKTLA